MGCQCSKASKPEEVAPAPKAPEKQAVLVVEHVSSPPKQQSITHTAHNPAEVVVSKDVVKELMSVAAVLKTVSDEQAAEDAGKISASKKKRMKKKEKAKAAVVHVETKDDEFADARSEPLAEDRSKAMRDEAYFSADNATPAKRK